MNADTKYLIKEILALLEFISRQAGCNARVESECERIREELKKL